MVYQVIGKTLFIVKSVYWLLYRQIQTSTEFNIRIIDDLIVDITLIMIVQQYRVFIGYNAYKILLGNKNGREWLGIQHQTESRSLILFLFFFFARDNLMLLSYLSIGISEIYTTMFFSLKRVVHPDCNPLLGEPNFVFVTISPRRAAKWIKHF